MKINDTIVTGVYMYDASHIYTKNDFVIDDGVIYFCSPVNNEETIQLPDGIRPGDSEHFKVYLGNKSANLQEYLNFLESPEGGVNEYISIKTLQGVLNHYLLGPDGKGIIREYVDDSSVSEGLSNYKPTLGDPVSDRILSDIMKDDNINHAYLRVSRNLNEIQRFVGKIDENGRPLDDDDDFCILKQYTFYKPETDNRPKEYTRVRVQELIDPEAGLIFYRSCQFVSTGEKYIWNEAGDFKCATTGRADEMRKRLNYVLNLYNSRLKVIKSLEEHLRSNFRYRKLFVGDKSTSVSYINIGNSEGNSYVNNFGEFTLLIAENTSNLLLKTHEVTINLHDKIRDSFPVYLVGDDYKISISTEGENKIIFTLSRQDDTKMLEEEAWISSVYYKEFYGI